MNARTKDIVFIGLFAAVISVVTMISIPTPSGIPITLQTFIIALTGYTLGSKRGTLAVVVYVLIGAIGLPVFSSFRGGIGVLVGLTGGFIIGFIPFATLCGIITEKKLISLLWGILGMAVCHILGTIWFAINSGNIATAFLTASLPYIPKDIISVVCAYLVSIKTKKFFINQKS